MGQTFIGLDRPDYTIDRPGLISALTKKGAVEPTAPS
jgi:hypothetical protein